MTHSEGQNSQEIKPDANVIIFPKVVCKSNAWNHREEPNSEWSTLEESYRRTSALTELLLVKQNIHTEQLHRSARETSPNSYCFNECLYHSLCLRKCSQCSDRL